MHQYSKKRKFFKDGRLLQSVLLVTMLDLIVLPGCRGEELIDKNPETGSTFVPCTVDVTSADSFEPNDTIALAAANTALQPGGSDCILAIHNWNDIDFTKLSISTAGYYSIIAHSVSGDLRPGLSLCQSDGNCIASSLVNAANKPGGLVFEMSATTYYLKARSWNFTTGSYSLKAKSHSAVTTTAITDTEPGNGTLSGAKSIAALLPGNEYTGATLFTSSSDTADFYRLSSLSAGSQYAILVTTPESKADFTLKLFDTDNSSNVELKRYDLKSLNAQFVFEAASSGDMYISIVTNENGLAVPSYKILFDTL